MKKLFFAFTLMLAIVGCKSSHTVEWPVTEKLDASVKDNARPLKAEVIDASYDFIYAKYFFVYQDSIMVVLNKPNDRYFVEFYNLNSHKNIKGYILRGNGPGEMLNTDAHIRGNEMFVNDFVKNQIATINIDSVLNDPDYEIAPPVKFSSDFSSPFITYYRDNEFIAENPYYFNSKELKIDNKVPRFVVSKDRSIESSKSIKHYYFAYNVSQGMIIPNSSKNNLIYASYFLNELEIYDMDLTPVKLITVVDDLKQISYRIDDGDQITFDKIIPYSYNGYYIDQDNFYLSYAGTYFTGEYNFKTWIFKFDWDGNFIESYLSPHYVNTISGSANPNVFYGSGYDDDGINVLWKLIAEVN